MNAANMQPLNPYDMPLNGISLIEASAGTGKTYSITALYLRLLLEHSLPVEKILVVTFTNAATEELRDRIRARLVEAKDILESGDDESARDPALMAWLRGRDESENDLKRLRIALASMDSAAVFTIHGFCKRVLTDHAFDTGMSFNPEFIENEDDLRRQAVEDFWRSLFGGQDYPPLVVESILKVACSPKTLLGKISERLSSELTLLPDVPPFDKLVEAFDTSLAELRAAHQKLKSTLDKEREQVKDFLYHDPGRNRQSYNDKAIELAWSEVTTLCSASEPIKPGTKLGLLSSGGAKLKKGHNLPHLQFFADCEIYINAYQASAFFLEKMQGSILRDARIHVRQRLDELKRARHQLYFDDLLHRLDQALSGKNGSALVARLRNHYPQAMIDEFQDTDEVQYRFFRRIYAGAGEKKGMVLIGDPKQAIYGFRGGDIFTYLAAAKDAQRQYSLDTNWRSSSGLVNAVNKLFNNRDDAFRQAGIDYHPVKHSPKADDEMLRIKSEIPVPLQFWKISNELDEKKALPVGDARAAAAAACARHIAYVLSPDVAVLGDRPLRAADISVLVRSRTHAPLIQKSLRELGINSVTLLDTSVFKTDEATALLSLLQAVVRCEDEALLRYALADRLLGYSAEALSTLLADDNQWELLQQSFFEYREIWRERGFIQAFQQLFRQYDIAHRLLSRADGERSLTNLLQLIELVQQASRLRPGLEELVRWLADEIETGNPQEEAKLRLESDAGLVKIVTMHASKGLEYPVVYIPFPWSDQSKNISAPWFFHDDDGKPCLHMGILDDSSAKARAFAEFFAEEMRLFYVAVTRAAKLCVMTWGKINQANNSPLAWLLDLEKMGQKSSEEEVFLPLQELAERAPGAILLCDPSDFPEVQTVPENTSSSESFEVRNFSEKIQRNWRINSYSALIRGAESDRPDYDAAAADTIVQASSDPIQNLPAGADFGLLVHQSLEMLDFIAADDAAIREMVESLSWRYGIAALREPDALAAATSMIRNLLSSELPSCGMRLGELSRAHRIDEMEFHFSVGRMSPRQMQTILEPFPEWRSAVAHLDFGEFEGLMHGYIDLVFYHDGRYWLADYKSNRLDDYGPAGLEAAMVAHHYPLQALVYSLALHRYLRQRLPSYDPAQHFGGVFYLFTRGVRPGSDAGIWFRRPVAALLDRLDTMLATREVA